MDKEVFFRQAAKAIKANATYSRHDDSWTIGVDHVRMIFEGLLKDEPRKIIPSHILILEEGVRRGFWKVDYDHEFVKDLVVLRQLIDSD